MKPQYIIYILFAVILVGLSLYLRETLTNSISGDNEATLTQGNDNYPILLKDAVVARMDPAFNEQPTSHSIITQALVRAQNGGVAQDEFAEIRAAFALSEELDRSAILGGLLDSGNFGNGCIGAAAAANAYYNGSLTNLNLRQIITLSNALATDGRNSGASTAAKETTEILLATGKITQESFDQIQSLSSSDLTVTGSCAN